MKFKMRVLHHSPAGNALAVATAISRAQQATCDQIPPAYPIEAEKLVFIGVEPKGANPDKAVLALCKDLNPNRTKNVAFYAVGSGDFVAVEQLKKVVAEQGVGIAGTTLGITVKGGLFKKGGVSDDNLKKAVDWAEEIVNSL